MKEPSQCPQCGAPLAAQAPEGLCPACLLKQGAEADTATHPQTAPFEPPPLDEVARLFPQLEILELIGKGGMGAVYKARQPALDRLVALKVLPPLAAAGFTERFNREARALARLTHPNIVAVHEFGQAGGLSYFIMEFVDGLNLRQIERAGKLTPREALQIIPQICEALQFAHDEGIVHRDIKPENILLDKKGRVKIADFGIAKILGREQKDPTLTEGAQVIGTPHYMAPEQVEQPQSVDHRADIFSLGVVFYEMLTGELPLGRFQPPSRKVQVDVRLDEVVLHALEKEPDRRYQHAREVKTDLETIASAAPAPPRIEPTGVSMAEKERIRRQVRRPAIGLLVTGILNWIRFPLFRLSLVVVRSGQRVTYWPGVLVSALIIAGLALLVFLAVHRPSKEPNLLVSGTVTHVVTGKPIAGARVADNRYGATPNRAPQEAWTDAEGRFGLRTWSEEHTVSASAPGYETKLAVLMVSAFGREREARLDFQLQPGRTAGAPSFGPVLERVVSGEGDANQRFLDLDNGQLVAATEYFGPNAEPSPEETRKWWQQTGIDAMGDTSSAVRGLVGFEMVVVQIASEDWDKAGPDWLSYWLTTSQPRTQAVMTGKSELPATCVFRTREGGKGLLQIIGFAENPPGVKIRYKLVQTAPGGSAASSAATNAFMGARFTSQGSHVVVSFPDGKGLTAASIQMGPSNSFQAKGEVKMVGFDSPFSPTNELTVSADGRGTYPTIQAAIDAAPPRTRISIGPGHFDESLVITKPISLIGAGWNRTIIGPKDPVPMPTPEARQEMERQLRAVESDADRRRLQDQFARELVRPVIRIKETKLVRLEGIKVVQPGTPPEGGLSSAAVVEMNAAQVSVRNSALVGAVGSGIVLVQGSSARIENTLVAAAWNTGIVIKDGSRAGLSECDIRNCHYAGITIGRGAKEVRIQACRISGAAWHGIRYDDASPILQGNLVFGNARSGIYASGATAARLEQNVLFGNAMNGMSCWFSNRDHIAGNTFVNNLREGLAVLGASAPVVCSNIFSGNPVALLQGRISGRDAARQTLGTPTLARNLFWANATNWVRAIDPTGTEGALSESVVLDAKTDSLLNNPEFQDPAEHDFSLRLGSEARRESVGASQPMHFRSPWPLQPEERAIIPDGDTRDSRQWKRPGPGSNTPVGAGALK